MNTNADFLREIAEHPDDLSCRLVYADWLDERRDSHSEFIRIQCALSELQSTDARYHAMRNREAQLCGEQTRRLRNCLGDKGISCKFVGGFLDELQVERGELRNLAKLPGDSTIVLRTLKIKPRQYWLSDFQWVHHLAESSWARSLWRLDVSSCGLCNQDVGRLVKSSHLAGLKALDLSWNNWLGDQALEWLSLDTGLQKLEELDLRYVGFGKHGMRILAESEKLQALRLLVINPQIRRRGFQYSVRHLEEIYGDRLLVC